MLITRKYVHCPPDTHLVDNLRRRLLVLYVLEAMVPACESDIEDNQKAQVCIFYIAGRYFSHLCRRLCLWAAS